MLNIELVECGLYDILKAIEKDLKSVLGKDKSKKQKDEMIYKTLGAIDSLCKLTVVAEVDTDM